MKRAAWFLASTILLHPDAALARQSSGQPPQAQPVIRVACERLASMRIGSSAIGLPTRGAVVTAAQAIAGNATSVAGYCLVSGRISPVDTTAPDIRFQVALPQVWNSKALMIGGGGFDGTIPKITESYYNSGIGTPSPLARGYAVFGGDGGHEEPATEPGSFLLNNEAYRNWMGDALKKTRDAATAIITAAYGKPPEKAYFLGGSSGGREGLIVAGRFPADWDGVISLYPARNNIIQVLGGMGINRAFAARDAFPSSAKRGVLFRAALAACDGIDGVEDGVISDVKRCNATFRPATARLNGVPIRCPGGADAGDTCLSDAQLAAIARMNATIRFRFPLKSGETTFPGYNIYTSDSGIPGTSPLQPMVSFLGIGNAPPAFPATKAMSLSATFGDNFIRYGIARDPAFDPLTLDPENPGRYAARFSELSALDTADEDLSRFAARGGKLILLHGTADLIVSPRNTEMYYDSLNRTMGPRRVASFLRFYEVPGFAHALSTNFSASWDYLSALENWVEKGAAPGNEQIVTDAIGVPGRTRPLCLYPTWPKYSGTGDVNSAASFACVTK